MCITLAWKRVHLTSTVYVLGAVFLYKYNMFSHHVDKTLNSWVRITIFKPLIGSKTEYKLRILETKIMCCRDGNAWTWLQSIDNVYFNY